LSSEVTIELEVVLLSWAASGIAMQVKNNIATNGRDKRICLSLKKTLMKSSRHTRKATCENINSMTFLAPELEHPEADREIFLGILTN